MFRDCFIGTQNWFRGGAATRVPADLNALRAIGAYKTGVHKPTFSEPHMRSLPFVPSIGGISHHWTENTADADIVTGAEVFVDVCRRLLAG